MHAVCLSFRLLTFVGYKINKRCHKNALTYLCPSKINTNLLDFKDAAAKPKCDTLTTNQLKYEIINYEESA